MPVVDVRNDIYAEITRRMGTLETSVANSTINEILSEWISRMLKVK
jgi:hypothetical protein